MCHFQYSLHTALGSVSRHPQTKRAYHNSINNFLRQSINNAFHFSAGYPALHDLSRSHLHAAGNEEAGAAQREHAQECQETGGMPGAAGSHSDADGTGPGAGLWGDTQQTVRFLLVGFRFRYRAERAGCGHLVSIFAFAVCRSDL